jgi:hypothetical protein
LNICKNQWFPIRVVRASWQREGSRILTSAVTTDYLKNPYRSWKLWKGR